MKKEPLTQSDNGNVIYHIFFATRTEKTFVYIYIIKYEMTQQMKTPYISGCVLQLRHKLLINIYLVIAEKSQPLLHL